MFHPYLIFTKKLLYAYGFDDLINVTSFQTTVVRTTVEKLHGGSEGRPQNWRILYQRCALSLF